MGGGTREAQYKDRFGLGTPTDTYGTSCIKSGLSERLKIRKYFIEKQSDGYLLKKEDQLLGTYKEMTFLSPRKALFKLDKGMLLEVTSKATRKILSPAKAGIIGFINSDGSLTYNIKYNKYQVRFGSSSDELLNKFNEFMNEVYGISIAKYPKKGKNHFSELVKTSKEIGQDLKLHDRSRRKLVCSI